MESAPVDYMLFPNFDDWTIHARPANAMYDFTKTSVVLVGDQKTLKEVELLLKKHKQMVEGYARRMKLKGIVRDTNSLSSSDENGPKGDNGLDFDEKFCDDDVDMGEATNAPPLSSSSISLFACKAEYFILDSSSASFDFSWIFEFGTRMDRINGLSDDIICHILSFLPLKEATSTSVLSMRWRYLFAFRPNLCLDDQEVGGGESFIDFVDRVLAVSGNFPIRNFSIKCRMSIDTGHVTRWMIDVLKHGVSNLDIDIIAQDVVLVPLEIFTFKTLVELKLAEGFDAMIPDHVSLPSLKTLFLDSIWFYNSHYCVLGKLLSACPVLEGLTICGDSWQNPKCCRNVSSSTLKKLTIMCTERTDFWDMTFDTPSLAYLEYSDLVPRHYPFVNLESLVEAKLDLYVHDVSNPTNLIKGLRNVEVLELSSHYTNETFYAFREAIPVLSKLFRLSITTDSRHYHWKLLPILLEKSPNLETLVIKGPLYTDRYVREYGLSCPVKVLKITEYEGTFEELEQMKHFLEKLPCLELVKVRASAINDKEKSRITKYLLLVPRSSNCDIQIKFL
ncbi:F-box-like domain superfamily [Arabidopsis suecica]|uniref:F-box-like domain superfamily n=1 Tax=Arabidopsis suecica TaxID=45249 RepID=A0A8T1YKN5_ARASU|nr:F-box-like domain superfamily [Arabidopsis suecica]